MNPQQDHKRRFTKQAYKYLTSKCRSCFLNYKTSNTSVPIVYLK